MTTQERQPRILVVEDEALVRMDVASTLADAGFDVVEATNALDALAVLSASSEIEVLITDVELFGAIDGVKLSWMVRQKWPPIHIIVGSGRHRAYELELPEGSQFFAKPYQTGRIVNAIWDVLGVSRSS